MPLTKVVIVGGGPAGLILAIELGRRRVPCILLEEDPTSPTLPKANATTSRTMEHYRRLGFAGEVRALGLPEDFRRTSPISRATRAMNWRGCTGAAGARRWMRARAPTHGGPLRSHCPACNRCMSRRC